MKLTKKKALEIAIELWEWIVDNPGKYKGDWPRWDKYKRMRHDCPFCQYGFSTVSQEACDCPLSRKYGGCVAFDCAYDKWSTSIIVGGEDEAHKAAVEFLAQLKEL